MQVVNLSKNVPTEREIADLEKRVEQMKQAREEAKKQILTAMKSDEILNSLGKEELLGLMKKIQSRMRGHHKKVRGSPVSDELKNNLISALQQGDHTLGQLEEMFGLSVSYISRIKKELKDAGKLKGPIMNAYEDHQLHHQKEQVSA